MIPSRSHDILNIVDELHLYNGVGVSTSGSASLSTSVSVAPPRLDVQLALVHTLAHAASLQLLGHASQRSKIDLQKRCLDSARAMTTIIRHLSEFNYPFLDPIIGVSTEPGRLLLAYT